MRICSLLPAAVPPGTVPVPVESVGTEEETASAASGPGVRAETEALDRYLKDTLGSVFRNMNSFQPGRRKPVPRSAVDSYTRLYLEKRRLFLGS